MTNEEDFRFARGRLAGRPQARHEAPSLEEYALIKYVLSKEATRVKETGVGHGLATPTARPPHPKEVMEETHPEAENQAEKHWRPENMQDGQLLTVAARVVGSGCNSGTGSADPMGEAIVSQLDRLEKLIHGVTSRLDQMQAQIDAMDPSINSTKHSPLAEESGGNGDEPSLMADSTRDDTVEITLNESIWICPLIIFTQPVAKAPCFRPTLYY